MGLEEVKEEDRFDLQIGLVDRTGWSDGEWDDEPDLLVWLDPKTRWLCGARRSRLGNWCGYINIPPGHPWYGEHYDSLDHVDVHGGLTFSGQRDNSGWWIGFDCGHSGDLSPGMARYYPPDGPPRDHYRTLEYVWVQAGRLSDQAHTAWMKVLLG